MTDVIIEGHDAEVDDTALRGAMLELFDARSLVEAGAAVIVGARDRAAEDLDAVESITEEAGLTGEQVTELRAMVERACGTDRSGGSCSMGQGPGRRRNAANGTGSEMHRGTYRRLLLAVCVGGAAPACDGQTDCVALNGRYLTGTVRMDLPEDTSKVCSLTDPQPEHRWPTSEGLFPPPVEFWLRQVDGGVEMIEEGGGHWSATLSHRGGGEQDGTPPPGLPFFDPQARFGVASYGVNKFGFPLPALGEGCAGNIQYFVSLESGILDEDCAAEIRVYHFQTVGRGLCPFSAWCEDRFVAHAKKVQDW